MKSLIIVCAGGFGRDVLSLVQLYNRWRPTWEIKGFIDDNPNALANVRCNYKVLGSIKDWQPKSDEDFVIGIAQPQAKEKVVAMLKEKGAHFASIVYPDTLLSDYCEIGEGTLLWGTNVGDNAKVGGFVHAFGAAIGQQSEVGDFSTITSRVNTTTAKIGKRVFVGSGAIILNGKKIGDDAVVGVGSIVVANVKAGTTVFGNPAKRIER